MNTSIRIKARRSLIWKISKEEFEKVIKKSNSITEVLSCFGLKNIGGNYKTLKKRLIEDGIDYSHLPRGIGHRKGRSFLNERKTLEDCLRTIFIKTDGGQNNSHVREYLKRFSLKQYKCELCKLEGQWNNLPLSLQMDHKNGNTNDNQLENLRWICPNCHTQTKTFAGRKLKIRYYCKECGNETAGYKQCCFSCSMVKHRKVERPSKEILGQELLEFPMSIIGKKYGVNGNSVKKWCQCYNLPLPTFGRGYWQKKMAGKL